jgi:hypothetical protein
LVDAAAVQVTSAADEQWIHPIIGLQPGPFRRLVSLVARRGGIAIAGGRPGRQETLNLSDRMLLVAAYYRYSANLQVAIDANTRLVVALGEPQPGNRNDTIVYRTSGINHKLAGRTVMADGANRSNPEVIIPYRKPADGTELSQWEQHANRVHRGVRGRVEHALARMKEWKILRDYRRAAETLAATASRIAHMYNIVTAG